MKKIELTISPEYVPSWTVVDAIRELFQNALDQEAQYPDNKASWEYFPDTGRLVIRNTTSRLTLDSLLLGSTTKADDANTIGQYGEGYKIAALVLLRNNKRMVIHNHAANETWDPRFVDSRRFKCKILTFFIDKLWFDRSKNHDLEIEVYSISQQEFDELLKPANLWLHEDGYKVLETNEYGECLSDESQKGMVYVNGLYVCKYDEYKFGYNFKPGHLRLDRDRKLVSDFDLKWLASRFWMQSPMVVNYIEEGIADVSYVHAMSYNNPADECWERFTGVHGPRAVPVISQEELDKVPQGYKGVLVDRNYQSLVRSSSNWEDPTDDNIKIPYWERLEMWYDNWNLDTLIYDDECKEMFQQLVEDMKNEDL